MEEYKNKKELKIERQEREKSTQKIKGIIVWILVLVAIGYGIFWLITLPKVPQSEVISRTGIHWHSTLSISINGENIEIPGNIGLGAVHNPVHTHEPNGTIHLEYGGIVQEDDTRLRRFFDVWGKDFSANSIMGNTAGEDGGASTIKMMVNGEENIEFENYMMKEGDKIEIIYNTLD